MQAWQNGWWDIWLLGRLFRLKEKKHKNKTIGFMSTGVLYHTRKQIRTSLNLPLNMIWADRRDHLVGDMNPLVGMPSSFLLEAKRSLEQSSITRLVGSVKLRKREYKKQNNIIAKRTLKEAQKVWRLLKFWRWQMMNSIINFYHWCHCRRQWKHNASCAQASIQRCLRSSSEVIQSKTW